MNTDDSETYAVLRTFSIGKEHSKVKGACIRERPILLCGPLARFAQICAEPTGTKSETGGHWALYSTKNDLRPKVLGNE
jgi:hypothetical protein